MLLSITYAALLTFIILQGTCILLNEFIPDEIVALFDKFPINLLIILVLILFFFLIMPMGKVLREADTDRTLQFPVIIIFTIAALLSFCYIYFVNHVDPI